MIPLTREASYAVHKVAHRQHVGGRYHHGAQLVEGYGSKPVFVVAFEDDHDPVAPAYAGCPENIGHLVAVSLYIVKSKDMFFVFGIAPDKGSLSRRHIGEPVDHIVSEIEVFRTVDGKAGQDAVSVKGFGAEILIYAHVYSLITAAVPIRRKRS